MLEPANKDRIKVPAAVRSVLWVDCSGAVFVGVMMLLHADWLRSQYHFSSFLYHTIATANLLYGTFSLVLALFKKRPSRLVEALAIANAIWGCACLITAVWVTGRASIFGVTHILAECVVVLWLAQIEWRFRALIGAN